MVASHITADGMRPEATILQRTCRRPRMFGRRSPEVDWLRPGARQVVVPLSCRLACWRRRDSRVPVGKGHTLQVGRRLRSVEIKGETGWNDRKWDVSARGAGIEGRGGARFLLPSWAGWEPR